MAANQWSIAFAQRRCTGGVGTEDDDACRHSFEPIQADSQHRDKWTISIHTKPPLSLQRRRVFRIYWDSEYVLAARIFGADGADF